MDYIRNNFQRFVFGGIVLQIVSGHLRFIRNYPLLAFFGWIILLIGTVLLMFGFFYYIKAKGRHPAWTLISLFPIIGWIILVLLKDKNADT